MRQTPDIRDPDELREYLRSEIRQEHPEPFWRISEASDKRLVDWFATLPDKRPATEGIALLKEAGVPVREPHHAIARRLATTLPYDDPDQPRAQELHRKGASLTGDEKHELEAIDAKHPVVPEAADDLDDEHEDGVLTESAGGGIHLLREAGVPLTARAKARLPRPEPTSISVDDLTIALRESGLLLGDTRDPLECLRESGVPTRG